MASSFDLWGIPVDMLYSLFMSKWLLLVPFNTYMYSIRCILRPIITGVDQT